MSEVRETQVPVQGEVPDAAHFSPGWVNWAWGLVCGFVSGSIMAAWSPIRASGGGSGMIVGAILGTYLLAGLFGWAAWRLGGRSPRGGRLTFALFCFLGVLGQIGQAAPVINERTALKEAGKVMLEHRAELMRVINADTPLTADQLPATLRRLDATFDAIEPPSRDQRVITALRLQTDYLARAELAYALSVSEFEVADLANFAGLERDGDTDRRRAACERYLAASKAYRTYHADKRRLFEQRLMDAKVSEEIREVLLRNSRRVDEAQRQPLERALAAREQLAAANIALAGQLDRTRPRWHINAKKQIEYDTDAEIDEINQYIDAVNLGAQEVNRSTDALQKHLPTTPATPQTPSTQPPAPAPGPRRD